VCSKLVLRKIGIGSIYYITVFGRCLFIQMAQAAAWFRRWLQSQEASTLVLLFSMQNQCLK
jgi:hypothetical protein